MRIALFVALAGLAVGACSQTPVNPLMDQAIDAYQKGDQPGFESLLAKADAAAEAAKATPDYDSACTKEGAAARRALALAQELHGLDAAPVFSMSDEARYIYLSADLHEARTGLIDGAKPKGCQGADMLTAAQDSREREGWLSVLATHVHDWERSLREKSPADFERRLNDGAQLLQRNHMGSFRRVWN